MKKKLLGLAVAVMVAAPAAQAFTNAFYKITNKTPYTLKIYTKDDNTFNSPYSYLTLAPGATFELWDQKGMSGPIRFFYAAEKGTTFKPKEGPAYKEGTKFYEYKGPRFSVPQPTYSGSRTWTPRCAGEIALSSLRDTDGHRIPTLKQTAPPIRIRGNQLHPAVRFTPYTTTPQTFGVGEKASYDW